MLAEHLRHLPGALLLSLLSLALGACSLIDTREPRVLEASLAEARLFGGTAERGVLLHLHGCDGIRSDPWMEDWFDYFRDRGFLIVAPDSFADRTRPPVSCWKPFPNKTEIYKRRYAQTKAAIETLRRRHPGKTLLVWGHSEGGAVANTIDAPVEGIVTTGYQCGYRRTARLRVPEETPLLAIIGTRDPYIINSISSSRFGSIYEICEAAHSSPNWQHLKIQGMGHSAPLSHPEIKQRVDSFLETILWQ